jgi:hypothetical protein
LARWQFQPQGALQAFFLQLAADWIDTVNLAIHVEAVGRTPTAAEIFGPAFLALCFVRYQKREEWVLDLWINLDRLLVDIAHLE